LKHAFLALLLCASACAQDLPPGVVDDAEGRFIVDDEAFEKQSAEATEQLASEGRLVDYSEIARKAPDTHPAIAVAPVSTRPLPPAELAETLRKSTVAVGLRYLDPKKRCGKKVSGRKWSYMIGATAFAVAPGILSTSLHVMTLDPSFMKEAQAVAVTSDGKVYPITGVIAASDRADTCLVAAPGLDLPALPIRRGVTAGEPVWCMSHPDGFTYMFTGGQVARVSRGRWDERHKPALHVEVTAEYCPGSSGGALTDAAGNVVAQVSSINNYEGMDDAEGRSVNGIVSARTCTAGEEILALTRPGANEPVPTPSPRATPRQRPHAPKAG
jgi:S1-C subfamily serine protease